MSRANSPAFSVQVGAFGPEALSVSGISGTEGVSRLYDFRVDFFTKDGEPLTVADLVGKDALLTLSVRDGSPRYVHGVVREVESPGLKTGRRRYRAHVVPKLWRLSQVHKSRIFQNKSVPDILKAVLGEGGIEVRLALSGSYAAREYCVQYRESDFAFVSRLMEWEGIFYFFEHTDSGHTLVLGDKPSAHAPLTQGQTLPLRPRLGKEAVDGEFVYALEVVHRLRPGAVHLKDFDFEKPALDISGKGKASEGVAALEIYDYPAGYVAPGVGKAAAGVRAEAAGMGGRTLTGEAIAPRLTPGFLLELDAPEDGTFAGEYLITEVVHSGMQPDVSGGSESLQGLYRNQFHLLPKAVPFRPRRLTPLPQIAGPQTATVTGPAGEEIHTDSHGRIKVQFHWDREGKKDEKSSCWVRVGQPWGGPAWGDVWLPRIGQEVIIRFLEGDPDRPLVAGAVYNGTNTVPYGLPGEKTKSTRKSASSLGSGGFNEVRIEDAAGEEEVFTPRAEGRRAHHGERQGPAGARVRGPAGEEGPQAHGGGQPGAARGRRGRRRRGGQPDAAGAGQPLHEDDGVPFRESGGQPGDDGGGQPHRAGDQGQLGGRARGEGHQHRRGVQHQRGAGPQRGHGRCEGRAGGGAQA
jgi:type VI secretion system secreted protein VgrG